MSVLKLKNASKVVIHGVRPGDVFTLKCDADGIPEGNGRTLDLMWRKRLREEALYRVGHIVSADEPIQETPAPEVAAPAPAPARKGKSASLSSPSAPEKE